MKYLSSRFLSAVVIGCVIGFADAGAAAGPWTDAELQAGVAQDYAIVVLAQAPLADWPGAARARNGKLDFAAGANGRYEAMLAQARNAFRKWLHASGSPATVVREYDTVVNGLAVRLDGASLDSLRAGPGVTLVEPSYLYHPTMNRSHDLVAAPAAWAVLGGPEYAGAGVKVGVIDTGIDQTHPFLADDSLTPPAGYPKFDEGNQQFTSNKVIVARVYYPGQPGKYTAEAVQDHGSHVSGTIAGAWDTTAPAIGGTPEVTGLSGVAPKAFLGNYNVFPGDLETVASHDLIQAIEDAVEDGMDVINMSLGGTMNGGSDQSTMATNRAAAAGVVVAVAAGNEGPGAFTVGSPGQASGAITAAASTNNHYFGIPVVTPAATFSAAGGDFNAYDPPMTAPLASWSNPDDPDGETSACLALAGAPYGGSIVVVDRGTCSFTTKIRNAELAGAIGVLVVNNVAGDPIAMGVDGTTPEPIIPAVMLALVDRDAIRAATSATVDGTVMTETMTENQDILASFSSRGPTNHLDIKPDVTAPGVNIYSSVPGGAYAMFQGTSMATPHVAGSAALLVQLHPDWTPAMIKSALVNTARRPEALGTTNPVERGSGIVDLSAAVLTTAVLDPVSVSFRKVQPSSGAVQAVVVTLTNVSGGELTYGTTASITSGPGVTASVAPAMVTLADGASAELTVTVSPSRTAPDGQYWGELVVSGGGATLVAPIWLALHDDLL